MIGRCVSPLQGCCCALTCPAFTPCPTALPWIPTRATTVPSGPDWLHESEGAWLTGASTIRLQGRVGEPARALVESSDSFLDHLPRFQDGTLAEFWNFYRGPCRPPIHGPTRHPPQFPPITRRGRARYFRAPSASGTRLRSVATRDLTGASAIRDKSSESLRSAWPLAGTSVRARPGARAERRKVATR